MAEQSKVAVVGTVRVERDIRAYQECIKGSVLERSGLGVRRRQIALEQERQSKKSGS
jgi:hypothetical protein